MQRNHVAKNEVRLLTSVCAATMAALGLIGCATTVDPDEIEPEPATLNCSVESLGSLGPTDVVFAFDNSLSSQHPSGIDVDGDGTVGEIRSSVFTDRGDSWLGVEIDAARQLVHSTTALDVRYSILTFSGFPFYSHRGLQSLAVGSRDAKRRARPTRNRELLDEALDQIMELGSDGSANFYAGARRANQVLIDSQIKKNERRKIVLYMSDTPGPIFFRMGKPLHGGVGSDVARATREAERHDIAFNTFGVTEAADEWGGFTLGMIAQMTGGRYQAAIDPARLYCHVIDSLAYMGPDREEADAEPDSDLDAEGDRGE